MNTYFLPIFFNATPNVRQMTTRIMGMATNGNSGVGVGVAAWEDEVGELVEVPGGAEFVAEEPDVVAVEEEVGLARAAGEFKSMTMSWVLW